jgi:hypothetical protein
MGTLKRREIEQDFARANSDDICRRLRQARASMLGTEDEDTFWACHDAAAEIMRLRKQIDEIRAQG